MQEVLPAVRRWCFATSNNRWAPDGEQKRIDYQIAAYHHAAGEYYGFSMTIDIYFTGGPLDGAIFEGELPTTGASGTYLAGKIYRDTECGLVNAIFEIFNPYMLEEGCAGRQIYLHLYRIKNHLPASDAHPTQLYATYVCASQQKIGSSNEEIANWVER